MSARPEYFVIKLIDFKGGRIVSGGFTVSHGPDNVYQGSIIGIIIRSRDREHRSGRIADKADSACCYPIIFIFSGDNNRNVSIVSCSINIYGKGAVGVEDGLSVCVRKYVTL